MKHYKCPPYPEKCPTAMKCRLPDPPNDCPYDVKGKRDHCCVSMGHFPPPMGVTAPGHGKWMNKHAT